MTNITTTSNEVQINPEQVLSEALNNAKELFPQMQESAAKAVIALSKVQKIETDEEDVYAQKLLVAIKQTYEKINGFRTTITSKFDVLKERFMEPEKRISFQASHKDSEANRVKKLRDDYANAKLQQQIKETQKLEAEKAKKEELARLKEYFQNAFFEGVMTAVSAMENGIADYFKGITLDNFEEKSKRFAMKPQLKKDLYEGFFITQYDAKKLPSEDYAEFLSKVKEQFTYDSINTLYVDKAQPIIDDWKAKLAEKKEQLQEVAALEVEDSAQAAELKKEQEAAAEKEKKDRQAKIDKEIADKKVENNLEASIEIQNAAFDAQIGQQSMGEMKNIRKTRIATITAPDAHIVKVLSQVMFACFTNPKFKGHIKKDAQGNKVTDDTGRPVYEEWVETLLDFYAKSCDAIIDGVEVKERVSTITKKAS